MRHVKEGLEVIGHNILGFEFLIWNNILVNFGAPKLKLEQCTDTMALGYAMALPGSLEAASAAVGIKEGKDLKGHRVMLQLSKPRTNGKFYEYEDAPDKFKTLYVYCAQDVRVERELFKRVLPLSKEEKEILELDFKINRRGVEVDIFSALCAIELAELEKKRLDEKINKLTNGAVCMCSAVAQITDWVKSKGVEVPSLAKADVVELLENESLPSDVKNILLLRQEAAKTSTAKIKAFILGSGSDGRIRGLFQFCGASTGRWAGRRAQLQNLPRAEISQEEIAQIFLDIDENLGDAKLIGAAIRQKHSRILSALSSTVRGYLRAGTRKDFVACDFSSIEARVLAWLAGEKKVLEIFKTHGKIYESAASDIYKTSLDEVTKEQRQTGKVAVLALGFGGGVKAFQKMAKVYNVEIPDDQAESVKLAWREANPNIVSFWYALEDAAIQAVINPGKKTYAGSISYLCKGSFLMCQLPSKRVIFYPYPKVEQVNTPWGAIKSAVTYMGMDTYTHKWERQTGYGGLFAENVTQAVARCLLADAMLRLEKNNYPVVMHIHDEIVCEVPKNFGSINEMENLMSELPVWAQGLPIKAEGWRGERFRK
jgi:DNA polymerase